MAKRIKKTETPTGEEVELSTLKPLQEFKYKGKAYAVRSHHPDWGIRIQLKDDMSLLFLPPETLVTPI